MPETKVVNREYKDRLFKFIFGNPENKEWTLSLYNAMNGSSYTNPDDIKLTTLEDVVYMGMKNDVSFFVADTMNFYEQQSSFNPNMPMRFLIYAGMVYSKYIEETKTYHRFSEKQQTAPTPKCVCFYNGTLEKDDRIVLKLSDSFRSELPSDIEVTVTMLNVNYGHNRELMERCSPLKDYSFFVEEIRINQQNTKNLGDAIDKALDSLPNDSLIKPYLRANKAEVKRMCITEYDEKRTMEEAIEDARYDGMEMGLAEGLSQGIKKGFLDALIILVKDGLISIVDASKKANMSVSEFEEKLRT